MNKRLMKKIDDYIKDKRKSNGGWAEVKDKDILMLNNIIRELVETKYQKDPDGDVPINWEIIDRTKYEPNHALLLVPYAHKDRDGNLRSIISNLSYFSQKLNDISRFNKLEVKVKE